jgi:geranylgeranyl diphosphate synthase type I
MRAIAMPDLEAAQAALERHLQEHFAREKERFDYGELFDPLYFDLSEFVARKGKRIRPLLFMLVYRAMGGSRSLHDAAVLGNAAALELLHTFILIHDDVIDRSERRRGLPTFHKLVEQRLGRFHTAERIGQSVAMVMGDIVFALAVDAVRGVEVDPPTRDRLLGKFLHYSIDTGVGEIFDILYGARDIARLSAVEIERMYHYKTTRYTFEAPAVLGATLAGAGEEKLDAIKAVMGPLGLAFQAQNDLAEFRLLSVDDPSTATDILEGKKTLLIREAFELLNETDRSFLQMCLNSANPNESTVLKIKDLIQKSGAVKLLQARCDSLFQQAEQAVGADVIPPEEQDGLRSVLGLIRQLAK